MNENEKNAKKVDNSNYRERFQFQLLVNDNIICQRYFKIPHYNSDCLVSAELYDTLDEIVRLIQKDFESKSRIFTALTMDEKTTLTGFASKFKSIDEAKAKGANWQEMCVVFGKKEDDETSVNNILKEWDETEFVKPWDVTFKFVFMVDDNPVYQRIWDGSQYPKYVRNSVDITNAKSPYPLIHNMNLGKEDLAVVAINKICGVCSNPDDGTVREYTKSTRYGNKKYSFSAYNKEYVNMWRTYCAQKYGRSYN